MSGVCPRAFDDNVIIPVIKDIKRSVNDPSNYCLINIFPIIAKVFESYLNSKLEKYFNFHDNQFDFVKNGGYNKAVFTVKSCFEYFTNRGSNIYFTCLDAVKAFDRVNHNFLLSCMIKIGFFNLLIFFCD